MLNIELEKSNLWIFKEYGKYIGLLNILSDLVLSEPHICNEI